VVQDYTKAMKWYTLAAAQGDGKAAINIGLLHFNGDGVPVDHAAAAQLLK
jgi:TPR repeat protein